MSESTPPLRERDAGMLRLMGAFFLVFGALVLAGLFWEGGRAERVVSVAAALVLLLTGAGALGFARWIRNHPR